METYHGYVETPKDALILFEACRLGILPRVQGRLSVEEKQAIQSGSVFVWDEREARMKRWTDGKTWSASRVSRSLLKYFETEGKPGECSTNRRSFKAGGLLKTSFSTTMSSGRRFHLISYYRTRQCGQPDLVQPTNDPAMKDVIHKMDMNMYPDLQMDKADTSLATTCAPVQGPPYVAPQPGQQPLADYGRPGCIQAASPVATLPYEPHVSGYPPTAHQQYTSYVGGQGMHPRNYVNAAPYEQSGHLLLAKSGVENTFPNTFPDYSHSTLPTAHSPFHDPYFNPVDQSATSDARSTSSYISQVALLSLGALTDGPTSASSATNTTPLSRTMSISPPGNFSRYELRRSTIHDVLNHTTPPASESRSIQLSSITSSPRASSVCIVKRGGSNEDARALRMLDRKFCI